MCFVRMIKRETSASKDALTFPTTDVCTYPCFANLNGLTEDL